MLTKETGTDLRPITAVALDRRIDLATLSPPPDWRDERVYAYGRRYVLDGDRVLYLFGFGAVVWDGEARISSGMRRLVEGLVGASVLGDTEETYFIAADPTAEGGGARVGWDRVVIPERRPELLAAVALLLAQSAALERYEHAVDALLDETLDLARLLTRRGRLPLGTRALIESVGRLTGDRLELARWFFLVDRPDDTWEHPRVAKLYDALFANLELQSRHDAILHKLGAAESATQSTLDLWHGRRSNALEWAIVLLIVVEIVFAIWGVV